MAFNQIVAKTNKLFSNENVRLVSGGTNENSSNNKQIKLWHLALLIGIPSATVVAYLCYRYYFKKDQKSAKSVDKIVKQQEKNNNAKLTFTPNNNENKVNINNNLFLL
jgi:hypothetical protein